MRSEWTNTRYQCESRGATLYGLPYDTSGKDLLAVREDFNEAVLDANSPYPLMVKFTKMVLEAIHVEKVKARNIMCQYDRGTIERENAWYRVRTLIDIEDYYMQRLHHYRMPHTQPLPDSLLA